MARGSGSDQFEAAWRTFFLELEEAYPDYVGRIDISLVGARVVVRGEVPSVEAKERIVEHLRQIPGVRNVLDMLVIAAPLSPAHPWDPSSGQPPPETDRDSLYEIKAAPQSDEGTRIVRHPSIKPQGPALEGQSLRITIDLALEPDADTRSEGVTISDLDEDWSSVPIRVEVFCADMTFGKGANVGTIVVRRNRASVPVTVEGVVGKIGEGRGLIHIRALFDRNNRHCGDAERSIEVRRHRTAEPESVGATVGWNEIVESRAPADMTIRILSLRVDDLYAWDALTHVVGGPADRSGRISVGSDPKAFAADLRTRAVRLEPGRHAGTLKTVGQKIWNITPPEFRELYWVVRRRLGADFSIQIVTDEPHIHWELMQPVDPATRQEGDHLMLDHPVARWVKQAEGYLSQKLPRGAVASFAPKYPDPSHQLPFALAETAWMCSELKAIPCEASRDALLAVLSAGLPGRKTAVLHFAGHGSFDEPDADGILMADGWIGRMDVDHTGTTLGETDGTLVVFNACDVGNASFSLGAMEGWASVLATRRFRGFVAPLWRVTDRHASDVIKTFMTGVYRENLTLGEAMRRSREAAAAASPTPFAYVCYGDVLARVV
jgi:hypothetical protein